MYYRTVGLTRIHLDQLQLKKHQKFQRHGAQLLVDYFGSSDISNYSASQIETFVKRRWDAVTGYIDLLIENNPDKPASDVISNTELWYIASAMSSTEAEKIKKYFNDRIETKGKEIYKYNINLSGPNEFLEDVRNYHNFRSQYDEYPPTTPVIARKT